MCVCFCCVILLFFAYFEVRLVFMVVALAGAAARTRRLPRQSARVPYFLGVAVKKKLTGRLRAMRGTRPRRRGRPRGP